MKNPEDGLGVQNIFYLFLNGIYSIYKVKELTKEQIKKYEMTEREIFEKYDNLSENKLNPKKTKNFMPKRMLWLLPLNVAKAKKKKKKKKKKRRKKNGWI